MEIFNIIFFDGLTSQAYQGTVTLQAKSWLIKYYDNNENYQQIEWPSAAIQRDLISNTSCSFFVQKTDVKQSLICNDLDILNTIQIVNPDYNNLVFSFIEKPSFVYNWKIISLFFVGLIASIALVYWYVMPAVAAFSAQFVNKNYEQKLGDGIYNNLMATETIDSNATIYTNQFIEKINFKSDYKLNATVIKSNELNAFALPGGHIVIYDSIIKSMHSYEELAALLGHEAGHITEKHTLKSILRTFSGFIFISLLFGDVGGVTSVLIEKVNDLNNLTYSRALEEEADECATKTLLNNEINLQGHVDLMTTLDKASKENILPKFLSTHPLTKDRIEFAKRQASKQNQIKQNDDLENLFNSIKSSLD